MRVYSWGPKRPLFDGRHQFPQTRRGTFGGKDILWHPSMHAKDIRRIYDTVKPPEVDTAYVDNPLKLISFVRSLLDAM